MLPLIGLAISAAMQAGAAKASAPKMTTLDTGDWIQGDWIINNAGSGDGTTQTAGIPSDTQLLWLAAGLGALWFFTRK